MDANEFGLYLRELRKKVGLTLTQLAEDSSVSQPHLSNIENGKRGVPSPEILKKLADALNVPYVTLMNKAGYVEENEMERVTNVDIKSFQLYEGYLILEETFCNSESPNPILVHRLFTFSSKFGYAEPNNDFFNNFLLEKIKSLDNKRDNVDEFEKYYEENKLFFDELTLIIQIAEKVNKPKKVEFIDLLNVKSLAYNGHELSKEDIERIEVMLGAMFPKYKPKD